MTNRSNRNQRKSKSTPPYNPVKKGRNQTFSPPIISQNIPDIAPMSQRDSPLSPLVAEESLSGDSFRSSTTEDDDSSQQSSTTDHQPIPKRLPPIFLTIKPEYPWRTMAKSLYESPEHEYVSTTSKINEIKLNCPDEVAFRSVQSFLASIQDKVGFHTHALPSQRTLKIVIKGIPLNITDQEITDELKSNGFEPAFIRTFSKNGHRIPLHMVTLANLELAKDIYQISKLFFINVKIEPYRSSGPAQCYKCQNFGHSSLQCDHSSRCVICGDTHASNSCIKPLDVAPKCCNCSGAHTANYRGCPFYINLKKQKEAQSSNPQSRGNKLRIINRPTPPEPSTCPDNTSTRTHTKASFAEVTGGQKPAVTEPSIMAIKLLIIIHKLLASARESGDLNANHQSWNCRTTNQVGRILHQHLETSNTYSTCAPDSNILLLQFTTQARDPGYSTCNVLTYHNELTSDYNPIIMTISDSRITINPPAARKRINWKKFEQGL
ncbi:hypothetical protein QTP88_014555 [Uroleucon formosanum]